MILLAQSWTVLHGFARCSALNGAKSDPRFIPDARKENLLAGLLIISSLAAKKNTSPTEFLSPRTPRLRIH
jgi:hypothetical protein